MRELTIGEKIFVDQNYSKVKPSDMAIDLKIGVALVRGYMTSKGYKSICRIFPPKPLTKGNKNFIRTNSSNLTINQLAIKVKKSFNNVKRFIDEEKLPVQPSKKGRPGRQVTATVQKSIIVFNNQDKKTFVRPPSTYSNPDWNKYAEDLLKQ